MDKKLLITTTYKNNFTLLELFYKFYNHVWNPTNFLFILGNTDEDKSKNINIINKSLHITPTKKKNETNIPLKFKVM